MTIRIDNLSEFTTPADIVIFCKDFAVSKMSKIVFVRKYDSRIAYGYVFVDIEDYAIACKAIEQLNKTKILSNIAGVSTAG